MPSFDSSRGRFKLSDRHIAVFAHLLDKETPPAELYHSLSELQQAGLVGPEGELSPLLRELLTALARPLVLVQAEITGEHGLLTHGLIIGQDSVYSHDAWPGEEESEYVPIEPQTLVWEMARKVKLRRVELEETEISGISEIKSTMGTLDEVFSALGHNSEDVPAARAAALDTLAHVSDLSDPERSALVELALSIDSTWRVTTAWEGKEGTQPLRSFAVWDCGHHGYWLRTQPQEPIQEGQVGPDSTLLVVRSTAAEIWEKLTDLLPDKEDFAR